MRVSWRSLMTNEEWRVSNEKCQDKNQVMSNTFAHSMYICYMLLDIRMTWCKLALIKHCRETKTKPFYNTPQHRLRINSISLNKYRSKTPTSAFHQDVYEADMHEIEILKNDISWYGICHDIWHHQPPSSSLSISRWWWEHHWWNGQWWCRGPGGIQSHWNWPSFNPLTTSDLLSLSTSTFQFLIINLFIIDLIIILKMTKP